MRWPRSAAIDPAAVLVKGDLTVAGTPASTTRFLALLRAGLRRPPPRGARQPRRLLRPAPFAAEPSQGRAARRAARAARHRPCPASANGAVSADQLEWLDDLARRRRSAGAGVRPPPPVGPGVGERPERYFGIVPDDVGALIDVVARRPRHPRLLRRPHPPQPGRRFAATGDVPWVEVACVKDFPGTWAEYRVHEGGDPAGPPPHLDPRGPGLDRAVPACSSYRPLPRRLRAGRAGRPLLHHRASMKAADRSAERQAMVRQQLAARGVVDPRVLEAFATVPRERFVPAKVAPRALRGPRPPDRRGADHLASPSWWPPWPRPSPSAPTTACSRWVPDPAMPWPSSAASPAHVVAVERVPVLAERARPSWPRSWPTRCEVVVGDGSVGVADAGPFDAVCVSASRPPSSRGRSSPSSPPADGSSRRLARRSDDQQLVRVRRTSAGDERRQPRGSVRFVPRSSGSKAGEASDRQSPHPRWPAFG